MNQLENYGIINDDEFYEGIKKHNELVKLNNDNYNSLRQSNYHISNENKRIGIDFINFDLKEHNAYLIHKFSFQVNLKYRYDKCTIFIDNFANTYNFHEICKPHDPKEIVPYGKGIFYVLAKSWNESERLPNQIIDIIKKFSVLQMTTEDPLNPITFGNVYPIEINGLQIFKHNYISKQQLELISLKENKSNDISKHLKSE